MQVTVDLFVDRSRREAVTGVLAAEAAGEVDVLAAVDVPNACALGARDDERRTALREILAIAEDRLKRPC